MGKIHENVGASSDYGPQEFLPVNLPLNLAHTQTLALCQNYHLSVPNCWWLQKLFSWLYEFIHL